MQIAANVLLVVLAFVTVLTTVAFRDTKRVHGPDVMGPAFFFVVSLGLAWALYEYVETPCRRFLTRPRRQTVSVATSSVA